MKIQTILLAVTASILLFVVSVAAIALDDGGSPYAFTSIQGETIEIYGGNGPYRYDSAYKAIAFRSFDWVSLVVAFPLFLLAMFLYRHGRLMGQFLLAALFTYLAYIYLIGFMGNTFNGLFLGWVALFSIGGFGLFLVISELDFSSLPQKLSGHFPEKPVAIYLFSVAAILAAQYLTEIITAYLTGAPPVSLDHYTTLELAGVELGIMIPLHILAGVFLWRQKAWGYVLATILAFAAFVVFIALTISLFLSYFLYGQGTWVDMGITTGIAIVAAGFSLVIFRQLKD
ncbi:MAG: hypothetical protein JW862_01245 [Anaerolineales bacterium]|nr:hypothetical protein [Anaerolineales bacterium]